MNRTKQKHAEGDRQGLALCNFYLSCVSLLIVDMAKEFS